ncbi:hypothetical protein A2574_01090 [Candidatus Shapirobacteria bacterium RIFOXYD1_FULL_38_32]|uniref:Protoporphyrinogen oxidase n=3 Tax=Candidatus Shapironibacteriota TaxID=1752721 RepID=A0A0G0MYX7_9BACT|nr:MAG: Protoporphyrinogen oxidase [Candidatus Shapirobacteria bacterium GW2011_GWE2_38_30]KKQ91398.1 MAG: Protoporphyrinogen oxidase [Candidatus Shapirobacteria bacterium GW2011_GWE1_38_92]OGL55588.1 MAG: hypothetical protein A2195_00300 [Candidatus Shapirobacteria bacterium RIFOXYA1_FULL_39_17]OGL57084.1 MAG: hypothetical protein A2410_03335 [Candidatus Shapirobacteria bacterium RIFOXYC1_FULL_38_24]OGL57439.1 MAG: hypothetical protein A2367_00090 [Candidatus Shapirobacteria bacterium RIFOXYB1
MKNKKIAIIGAGLTGLTAGYELSKKGHKVTIFEKSDDIGGLVGGFEIEGTSLEKAYHHIFRTDKYIIALTNELGLQDRLKWYESKTGLYFDGKVYPFAGAVDLLRFKPLNFTSKLRLGLVKIWLEKDNNWEKYKKIPAYKWMKKWCGDRAYEVIWEPLLKGKFDNYYKKVSMAWLWARINTRGNSKSKDGKEYLGYFEGGFRIIADQLAKRINKMGGEIKLNTEINPPKSPFDKGDFDAVIYTGAAKNIDYIGAVMVIFESKQNLSKFYWHNINDSNSPFLAFIQHTNLIDKSNYGGKHVYYLGTYLPHDHKYFGVSEEQIKNDFYQYLKKIFPDFDRGQIENDWVFRFKNAQHIVDCNYKVPPYKISEKVYQANFAQIFPEDRGTNYAVREGIKIAEMIG